MWKVFRATSQLTIAMTVFVLTSFAIAGTATAQFSNPNNTTYYNAQTISHGLYLPPVTIPHGADEVRAADGTTCRSNMAGNDGYLDLGAVGNQDPTRDQLAASVYGRVVIPLGERPARLNCQTLYGLEMQRLRHELEMARMGAENLKASGGPGAGEPATWESEGWQDHRKIDRSWKKGTSTNPE